MIRGLLNELKEQPNPILFKEIKELLLSWNPSESDMELPEYYPNNVQNQFTLLAEAIESLSRKNQTIFSKYFKEIVSGFKGE